MILTPQAGKRMEQHGKILLAGEATGERQQPYLRRQSESDTQIRRAALRTEYLGIHAEGLVHGVVHAQAVEEGAHRAARCKDHVEMVVQPANVAADDLLADGADPAADQLREIGMVEGGGGHAAAPRDDPGAPGRMKGVSGLDDVRFERVQNAIPAAWIQREAVVECAGNRQGGQSGDAAACHLSPRPRYDDRMLPGGMRGQPRVLRGQVPFDAAARRRIEQGGVDQVHAFPRNIPGHASKLRT